MEAVIRKVQQGDASNLAYIQTESWKAAFTSILDAEILTKCTNIERATSMYQRLLDEKKGNGYLLTVDGKPHCIAYWDAARDSELAGKAELICIHSLPNNWHKGYGSMMMNFMKKTCSHRLIFQSLLLIQRKSFIQKKYDRDNFMFVEMKGTSRIQ